MNSNPTSIEKQPRELQPRPRFANTLNSWSSLFSAILAASYALSFDPQKPIDRLLVFTTVLTAVAFGIMAMQEQLERRIATLLDCLEQKGVISAEDRAAIGIVAPKTIDAATMRGVRRLALIIPGGAAILIALGFFFATCSGTR
jgi:hypothetical protein